MGTQKFKFGPLNSARAREMESFVSELMTVYEKRVKKSMAGIYATGVGLARPTLSLDRVAAFRYYRRQFFKPRHTAVRPVRHFRLTGPYRASG